jgi:ketosteroid isomerase-like protein
MSQENLEVMRTAMEAFNRRDGKGFDAFLTKDAEIVPVRVALEGTVYSGPNAATQFLRGVISSGFSQHAVARPPHLLHGHRATALRDTARAMSEENVEVVRRAFEASKRRDDDEVFPLYDPEVEIESGYDGRVYRGLDGVRAFFRDWLEVWDEIDWEAEEWIDAGDHVIALLRVSGRGKLSGVPVERSEAHLWTLRDGKLLRLKVFDSKDGALEAAGLRE